MNLQHIVQRHHQLPLAVHLALSAQAESLDADSVGDVTENRFNRAKPLAVDMAPAYTVDLVLHSLDNTGFVLIGDVERDVDLTGCMLVLAAQTAPSQPAAIAVLLIGLKLHE